MKASLRSLPYKNGHGRIEKLGTMPAVPATASFPVGPQAVSRK
jgi:hypothetical protein